MGIDPWKQFEKRILTEVRICGNTCIRIPDKIIHYNSGGRYSFARGKTEFDFVAGINGRAVFFDAKALSGNLFNLASIVTRPKSIHQYYALQDAYRTGNIAGYLVWFYGSNIQKICWIPINLVASAVKSGFPKSFPYNYSGVKSQDDFVRIDLGKLIDQ